MEKYTTVREIVVKTDYVDIFSYAEKIDRYITKKIRLC